MTSRRRAGRFALVGLLGFGLQMALLRLLVDVGHLHYLVATALAVEGTIVHNFVWHSQWTWRDLAKWCLGSRCHNAYACVGHVQERLFIHAGQCRTALPEQ